MKTEHALIDVDFIKCLMKVKNLTESQFAEKIGVSHSTVNRVINGTRGAGNKFVYGIIRSFPDVKYEQLFSYSIPLTKGNKNKESA